MSSAPIAWDGLVFVGNAGGDFKARGACTRSTRRPARSSGSSFWCPKPRAMSRGPLGATPLNMSTWQNAPGIPISGAGTWTSYTLDTKTGRLYVPRRQSGSRLSQSPRARERIFTDSVIVLDAKTGTTHHSRSCRRTARLGRLQPAVLIQTMGGKQLMVVAPKDGHLYGFDLATNGLLYRVPVTQVEDVAETFSPGKAVHFCPGRGRGMEQPGL